MVCPACSKDWLVTEDDVRATHQHATCADPHFSTGMQRSAGQLFAICHSIGEESLLLLQLQCAHVVGKA
jgi:hypothetical protein